MSNDRDDPDRDDRADLEDRIEELETTLRGLQTELGRPPRGPMGLPRPPTPREVLSFTGEYAIPTLISMLEANVRALKALQQIIRLVDPEYDPTEKARSDLSARAGRASRATLDRLQDTLNDVEGALTEGGLPEEPRARRILEDARRLSEDIGDEIATGSERADEGRELADAADEEMEEEEEEQPQVDVDAELRSIRDELDVRGNGHGEDDDSADDGSTSGSTDDSDDENDV
ncbi:hypothetical protein [Haladaptatus sp. DYF46]|uniref:DUF7547 family protein n=1 Tax=Haladaptatus sp. DYF46 TaxID=2886041 RepID=UPI001E2D4217|nr:hypothetical protein [Haladaptatus sp. DYF46]